MRANFSYMFGSSVELCVVKLLEMKFFWFWNSRVHWSIDLNNVKEAYRVERPDRTELNVLFHTIDSVGKSHQFLQSNGL